MTAIVERYTEAEARARRDEILAEIGDEAALRERARQFLLDPAELALLDELDDFNYLIGE